MADVTEILQAVGRGEHSATEELLVLLYNELRQLAADRLAKEKPGQTLQTTALVHEVYLRLMQGPGQNQWENRGHFFAAAAEAMRRIVIEHVRKKKCLKRGGDRKRVALDDVEMVVSIPTEQLLELNDALDRLEEDAPVTANVVKLRYYAGLSLDDIASALDLSRHAVTKHWVIARAWFLKLFESEP